MVQEMKRGDHFILSKGHAAPSLYVVMNYLKKISDTDLLTFHNEGTKLPAHTPNFHYSKDIPFPTGSLGHGISLASGLAHANKYFIKKNEKSHVFCLISDGECNEGQTWEAAQYASHFKLSNLVVMIDKNGLQALGNTVDVLGDSASQDKWKAFGFDVFESDGHDLVQLSKIFKRVLKSNNDKPKLIIFNTIKGHGVSFMENTMEWHYNTLTEQQYEKAIEDIEKLYEK
jgi:transketolase